MTITSTWLQAIQLINLFLSAQNHRGDLIIHQKRTELQRTHPDDVNAIVKKLPNYFWKATLRSFFTSEIQSN